MSLVVTSFVLTGKAPTDGPATLKSICPEIEVQKNTTEETEKKESGEEDKAEPGATAAKPEAAEVAKSSCLEGKTWRKCLQSQVYHLLGRVWSQTPKPR